MADEYMSTPDAAKALGVSVTRIQQLINSRRLPASKIAGRWLIKKTDLDAFEKLPPGRPKGAQPKY